MALLPCDSESEAALALLSLSLFSHSQPLSCREMVVLLDKMIKISELRKRRSKRSSKRKHFGRRADAILKAMALLPCDSESEAALALLSLSLFSHSQPLSCREMVVLLDKMIKISKLRKRRSKRSLKRKHFSRRADAILKFLSGGCYLEAEIRRNLGDNPDTSKALRMLLEFGKVKRSGEGGRQDPYIYTVFVLLTILASRF
ncbi:hypothetical protein FCV25MIE_14077 [Fagus crenata]